MTDEKIVSTLQLIAGNSEIHARFVNTLSMLEYIGARKILKSQPEANITAELLAHISEEVRHAQVLKRVALKMSAGRLESYSDNQLLGAAEARAYIQGVDHTPLLDGEQDRDAWASYLFTTLLIEERAGRIYPIYESILANAGYPGVLKGIVQEEENHLADIQASLRPRIPLEALNPLRELEESAFSRWWNAVEAECRSDQSRASRTG